MEIKTKFNIGEPVYILEGYKIHRANIVRAFLAYDG